MAKGQLRGNKETKKPKKSKEITVPISGFINAPKTIVPTKTK